LIIRKRNDVGHDGFSSRLIVGIDQSQRSPGRKPPPL
jgi:hypothetical protein